MTENTIVISWILRSGCRGVAPDQVAFFPGSRWYAALISSVAADGIDDGPTTPVETVAERTLRPRIVGNLGEPAGHDLVPVHRITTGLEPMPLCRRRDAGHFEESAGFLVLAQTPAAGRRNRQNQVVGRVSKPSLSVEVGEGAEIIDPLCQGDFRVEEGTEGPSVQFDGGHTEGSVGKVLPDQHIGGAERIQGPSRKPTGPSDRLRNVIGVVTRLVPFSPSFEMFREKGFQEAEFSLQDAVELASVGDGIREEASEGIQLLRRPDRSIQAAVDGSQR